MPAVRPVALSQPAVQVVVPPLRLDDQGISAAEAPHAARVMARLFTAPNVDMLVTYDQVTGEYELRSRTGAVRWRRMRTAEGALSYVVTKREGVDPTPSMDPRALATLEQELAASGNPQRSVPRARNSYPRLFERLTQLFDNPRAPDIAIIPTPGGDAHHAGGGSHGVPDVVQSRAPLIVTGPGFRPGAVDDAIIGLEDLAPTMAQMLGVSKIDGTDASGVRKQQYLRWQDGKSFARTGVAQAERGIIITVDGLSQTAMLDEIAKGGLPNFARLMRMGTTFRNGALAQYPSVTWPNHHTIVMGASPGHTGIVNNTWYERDTQEERVIVSELRSHVIRTAKHLDPQVETLYEAVNRTYPGALTLAVNQPAGRGATVSTLDLAGLGDLARRLPAIVADTSRYLRTRDRADQTGGLKDVFKTAQDAAGAAMMRSYYGSGTAPKLTVLEFSQVDTASHDHGPHSVEARSAMRTIDAYLGSLFTLLDSRGLTASTAIMLTADHGMEAQDIPAEEHSIEDDWKTALDAAAADGDATIESTRFVYLRTMRLATTAIGSMQRVTVEDDDRDPGGAVRFIEHASVVIRDATGREVRGATGANGQVDLDVAGMVAPLQVVVDHAKLGRSTTTIAR